MKAVRSWFLGLALWCGLVPWVWATDAAYTVAPVKQGGIVSGKVTITGIPPNAKLFQLRRYAHTEFCGQLSDGKGNRLLHEFVADESGGFKDVVVAIEGIKAGKPFPSDRTDVLTKLCEFLPFVTVVQDRGTLSVKNEDPVPHITQGYELEGSRDPVIFNLPLMEHDIQTAKVIHSADRRIFWMQCGIHPYMQTWGYTIRNPYYEVTGPDGSFRIADVPPGKYKLIAWHPYMTVREKVIVVSPEKETKIDLPFDGEELRHFLSKNAYPQNDRTPEEKGSDK